ncbi:acyltransferase family protein [Microbacterium sp. zg.B48]|uniref:acyltransferase family protein n=1 Tax=Microbacterium sp. zg.B48 TaxID=2969408 RepID=UPI00214AC0E5|nr:acyltransferase family protein [Microbacterium sp. zg.B48]MCR2764222.1 acyltransferase family protein [Microbacterium sp. zg.B48]
MRVHWIDSARGVAILLVVFYHSAQWAGAAGFLSEVWLQANDLLATMRLPLFFALSGMLAVKWMTMPWRELLRSKLAALLWLYLVWQAVTTAVYMVVPNVSTPGKSNAAELITALATPLRPQGALWFIWALALFFVLCRGLWAYVPGWVFVSASAGVSTLAFGGVITLGNVGWDGALENFVFFAAGVTYAPFMRWLAKRLRIAGALLAVAVWAAFILLVPVWALPGLNLVSRGLGLAAGIGLGVILARASLAQWAGRNTLYLYLPHYTTLTVLAYVASTLPLPDAAHSWLPLALFAGTLAVCLGLWALALRSRTVASFFSTPDWLSRLIGRKNLAER